MDKLTEAKEILNFLGLPKEHQNLLSALTFLALCKIGPNDYWENATNESMTISNNIMQFVNSKYDTNYQPNTRESFRKNAIKPLVDYNIVDLNPDNPNLSTTSSKTHYAISQFALNAIRQYGNSKWPEALENFLAYKNSNKTLSSPNILLRNIYINNYKSISSEKIELGRLNVFIGANGCGKTNILEAVAMVGASRSNDLTFDGLYSRGVRIAKPELTLSSFTESENPKETIDINFTFENEGGDFLDYRCSLASENKNDAYAKWNNIAEEQLYPEVLLSYFDIITKENPGITGQDLLEKANQIITSRGLKKDARYDSILSEYAIFDLNTKSLRGILPSESKKTPLGLNGEGLDLLISSFNSKLRKELDSCLQLFDWLSEIVTDKSDKFKLRGLKPGRSISTLYFKDKYMQSDNNTFSAENSNEGVLHVLFYLALFISDKTPSFFAIDNIETALNPKLCSNLISKLSEIAKESKKQVLITTHNPAVLDGLNLLDPEQRLFEVYRDSKGKTKTRRIKFKSDLSDKKFKLSEMWLKGSLGAVPTNF